MSENNRRTEQRDGQSAGVQKFQSVIVEVHDPFPQRYKWQATRSADTRRALVLFPGRSNDADDSNPIAMFAPAEAIEQLDRFHRAGGVSVCIPVKVLPRFLRDSPQRAIALPDDQLVRAFRAFAIAITHTEGNSRLSRYAIEEMLISMASWVLLDHPPFEERVSLVDHARSAILAHRHDPSYSVGRLASDLHVSLRSLQRAFARVHSTPHAELRRSRVTLAASLLTNPLDVSLTIEDVARRSGFSDAMQLRRGLRYEGLPLPAALRRHSRG